MADRLSSLLQNLLALVQSTSAQRAHEGRSVASDITQICMESLSESELAYCSSVLFKEGGILTFLKNSAGIDEFAVCKEELLHLVESYVCKMGKKFLSYVKPVKDVCVSLFTRERISRVKVATFGPLIAVVQLCQHSTLKEDLEIGKIVEKYFLACTQPSKHTATVKSGIYQLLGTLAEVFPEKTEAYAPRLIDVYLSNLKQEMDPKKSKKPEMLVISGCLKGLGGLLVNFPPTDPKVLADIFHFTRKAIDPQVSLARYDVPKGGLMLLARHASLFRGYLTKDHQNVYAVMFKWCNHHNKDMKSAGLDALDAFLQQVAQHLLEGGRGNAASTAVFKTFITIFQELIDAPSTGTREMSVVVRGYGYFAAPCRMLLKDQDVKFMFDQVIKRSEYLLISGCELLEEKIYHLPSFLTSLASIVNEIVDVTGDFLGSLERLVVLLFEHFPRLGPAIRFSAYKAMNILLATLAQKGALLKALVSNIVYQGLIRTCSHPVSLQGMITRPVQSTDESQASYNDYVELWFHIMKPQRKEEQAVSQLTPDQRQYLYATLYDALIQSVLKVAHKLDLSATKAPRLPDKVEDGEKKETEPVVLVSDPTASLQPAVVKDFQVFINLVDFCRTVLPAVEPHNFRRWVYLFSCDIISMSAKQPLVSGFYKMLATGLTICSKIHYFQPDEGQLMGSQELMETDAVDDTERGLCFTLFRKFIKETLEKLKQYKDDLQASCLLLILSAPKEFVEIDVIPIVTAVQIALNLGISYMPLAEAAISALESWTSQLPPDVFKPHLPTILPCLDTYLQSAAETELYSEEAKDVVTLRSHPSARSHGTGKLPIKVLKALKEGMASSETPLHKLRLRIVQFLGSLGGEYNIGLVDSSDSQSLESAIAWDTAKHLDFSMPFNDMKLSIYLDPFLPRVTELALSASDRQTKVAACELLHSMTLFLIGKGAIQPDWAKSKSPMIVLYKRLFPTLMRLACDVEQVAVQLFRPLMFQIIHWFTGNKMYECPETVVLLEAMMDCVVDSNSGSLRDFGAECVREFLQWSIKQTTPKELEKRPHNVKSLLLRLQSLSQHPNPFKRLGSAIAFNNIYTIFREEESVIDLFVLELLVNFVYSLRMAHKDDESLGTQEQCKQVIIHLERMVKVKSHVLLKVNKDRRKPRGFREASIGHLIEWLLSQCGRPETEARHMCMRLFCSLVPNAFDQDTPSNWMQKTLKHLSADYLNKKFETAGGRGGIWKYSTALILTEVFSLDQIISWLGDLLAALDCYTWVLGERLLRLTEILSVSGKTKYESQLFTALSWFVNGLAWGGIEDAQKWFAQHDVGVQEVFTPMEVEQYNRAKCTLTVRLFDFLIICLGGYPAESVKVIPSNFFGPKLCELVVECVLNPSSVGFDLFDVEVVEHLPSKMVQLCSSLVRFLKESDCFSVFSKVLFTRLRNNNFSDVVPNILVDENVSWKLHQTVSGFRQLNKAGLLQSAWSDKIPFSQLGNFLLDAVMSSVRPEMGSSSPRLLSPSTLSTYKQILLLALDVGVQSEKLISCLDERSQMVSRGGDPQLIMLGSVFYLTFQSEIDQYMIQESSNLLPLLIGQADKNPGLVSSIAGGILEPKDKTARKKLSEAVVATLFANWSKLSCWWGEKSTLDTKRSAVSLLRKALSLDKSFVLKCDASTCNEVFEMYLVLLGDSTMTLSFKSTVLELLSSFATVAEPDSSRLQSSLEQLVANNFPLKSSEFDRGSTAYRDYISVIDKILLAMVMSQSVMLMKIVISFTCRETRHIHEDQILESVVNFAKRLKVSSDKAKSATNVCYELFCADGVHSDEVRRAVAERFLVPMLKNVHKLVLLDFFVHHIGHMMGTLTAKLGKAPDDLLCQLSSRLCVCEMLTVLYERLTSVELSTPTGQVNRSFCEKFGRTVEHGKELTREITKVCNDAKSEDVRHEITHKELRRQYHCAAYKVLVALMCCTQTEMKFYTGFLFKEDLIKHQLLWDNLIDAEKTYEFAAELESPMFRKGQLNAIRQQVKTKEEETVNEDWHAPRYLSSQYLADSSLREEVSQFDFSTLSQIASQDSQPGPETGTEGHVESEFFVTQEVMEQDELNQHESMPVVLHLLDHMVYNKITPSYDEGAVASAMPPWMACLHKKMTDSTTAVNVRLFLARVIINRPKVFQPYAKFWLIPLVELIVSGVLGTSGLNYFIIDVVVTMLSWAPTKLEDQYLASQLLEFLMMNCSHNTRAVLRNNLEVIKCLVESWKGSLSVPSRMIYENLRGTNPSDISNCIGIQFLGIFIANDLCPFNDPGIDKDSIFKSLAQSLRFKYQDVYGGAAAAIGMTMSHLYDHESVKESTLHDEVTKTLSSFTSTGQAAGIDRFITCLHLIQEHYPEFSDRFVNKILFLLPNVHGDFRRKCLEIIYSRATEIPNLYVELKAKGFSGMLCHRDGGTQLVALCIVHSMLKNLTLSELKAIVPDVLLLASHASVLCRKELYQILIWLFNSLHGQEDITCDKQGTEMLSSVKTQLLKGLADENETLRLEIYAFWSQEARLSVGTVNRLAQLLAVMYSPQTESSFLSYSTNLMLELTSRSPDYSRNMFDYPLSECKFEDKSIDLSWQKRHLLMVPLFAATQSQSDMTQSMASGIRATQQPMDFTPTQQEESYDWLQPATQSQGISFSVGGGPDSQTQSTLLFGTLQRRLPGRPVGEAFGTERLRPSDAIDGSQSVETQKQGVLKLKRRFVKDRVASSRYYAQLEERKKRARRERMQQQKASRDAHVVMYRKYRDGDLPDIQIKHSELIRPLQALAQRDNRMARLLFVAVFQGVYSGIDESLVEASAEETHKTLQEQLNAVLDMSVQYFPPFIGAIQDVCAFIQNLSLEPAAVSMSSVASHQQGVGIQLLEKQLLKGTSTVVERPAKRMRTEVPASPEMTSCWIELAKLYKSINDYDAVQGIFKSEIGTKDLTNEALSAEGRGDYLTAYLKFKEAYNEDWNEGHPVQEEEDLWEASILSCCSRLLRWTDIEKFLLEEKQSMEYIWDDDVYQQEVTLPYLLRCKLKQCVGQRHDPDLLRFMDNALRHQQHKALLEGYHCETLSLLFIVQDDLDRARYYVNQCFNSFMQEWAAISRLVTSGRSARLQSIQTITEMKEFLDFMSDESNFDTSKHFCQFLSKWRSRLPHPVANSVDTWNDIIVNRMMMMDKMLARFERLSGNFLDASAEGEELGVGGLQSLIKKECIQLYLKGADSACCQLNFAVAKRYLSYTKKVISEKERDSSDKVSGALWIQGLAKMHCQCVSLDPKPENVCNLINILPEFDKFGKDESLLHHHQLRRQHCLLKSRMFELIAVSLAAEGDLIMETLGDKRIDILLSSSQSSKDMSVDMLRQKVLSEGFQLLVAAREAAKQEPKESKQVGMKEALVALAIFCDEALRRQEDEDDIEANPSQSLDLQSYPGIVVESLLDSMHLGSEDAQQRFPRILQLVEKYSETQSQLIDKAARVPPWMFIGWINQMVAILDKAEGLSVVDVLIRIAKEYPQALCYPFKTSFPSFQFDKSDVGAKSYRAVEDLKKLLDKPLIEALVTAFEQLTEPEFLLKDWQDNEARPLMQQSVKARNTTAIRECWKNFYAQCLDVDLWSSQTFGGTMESIEAGDLHKDFVKNYALELENKFGKDGTKLASLSLKDFNNICREIFEKVKKTRRSGESLLKIYSPWLSRFKGDMYLLKLEIPGQYQGKGKPLPEYHVKIAGFDPRVRIMHSLRKPKRVTILGDDGKEYMYLVKGGEDLRLDQRIEQLFKIMNSILFADPGCCQRHLCLRTYEVIPMSNRMGIIEWVDKTVPLKNFLESAMEPTELQNKEAPKLQFQKWLDKFGSSQSFSLQYKAMYKKAKREEVKRVFESIQAAVPFDLLKRGFLNMVASPEAFLAVRSLFVRSHACLSICNYVLGIGDRHLSNFMIDQRTGGMIGIDFGHAFGSATHILPLPELMPFRLTRQFTSLLQPLKEEGQMRNAMIATMRALSNNSYVLLNTADVFIKEPLLDWKSAARRHEQQGNVEKRVSKDESWFPRQKLSQVRRKLNRFNPSHITRDDLRLGHGRSDEFKDLEKILLGERPYNVRARAGPQCRDVEEQIACLVDQATDPNILGRTYLGWEPWM